MSVGTTNTATTTEMDRGLLEVLDRGGRVAQRVRVGSKPLRIGRGYDCDLILDDPFVSPDHVQVAIESGSLRVLDLDSDNGLFTKQKPKGVVEALVAAGEVFRIGHTDVRFVTPMVKVAPARRDVRDRGWLQLFANGWFQSGLVTLALLVLGVDQYYEYSRGVDWAELAAEVAGVSIFLLVWAIFWSLLNRMLSHRFNFVTHLAIASLGVALLWLIALSVDYSAFAFTADRVADTVKSFATLALAVLIVFCHLRFASDAHLWRLAAVAGSVAAFGLFFQLMSWLEERDDFEVAWQHLSIKSPRWLLDQPEDPEVFLQVTDELADQLQAMIDEDAQEE